MKARQEAIKELVKQEQISDQKELVNRLKTRFGIVTNQAAVSRDIRQLGITKRALVYELPAIDIQTEILKLAIQNITHNETTIVITTYGGLAPFVGDCIDSHSDLPILGCLAGENAVFVTPRSINEIEATYQALCEKLYFKKGKKDE
jgi:transcriptional regulator of arginine metabolism